MGQAAAPAPAAPAQTQPVTEQTGQQNAQDAAKRAPRNAFKGGTSDVFGGGAGADPLNGGKPATPPTTNSASMMS